MSQEDHFSVSELHRKRAQVEAATTVVAAPVHGPQGPRPGAAPSPAGNPEEEPPSEWSVDKWRILAALKHRWRWLVSASLVMGLLGAAGGYYKGKYAATIKLIQLSPSGVSEFRPDAFSPATLTSLLRSPELMRRVAQKAQPHLTPDRLLSLLTVDAEAKSELVNVTIQGKKVPALVNLVNLYATEAVDFTRDLQLTEARRSVDFYRDKVATYVTKERLANEQMLAFLKTNKTVDPKAESEAYLKTLGNILTELETKKLDRESAQSRIKGMRDQLARQNPLLDQLAAAQSRLSLLLATKTEKHPDVESARNEIAALERQLAAQGTNASANTAFPAGSVAQTIQIRMNEFIASTNSMDKEIAALEDQRDKLQDAANSLSRLNLDYCSIKAELEVVQQTRGKLTISLQEAQVYADKAQGYYRIFAPVTADDVDLRPRMDSLRSFGVKGAVVGLVLAAALVFLIEMKDRTMKTVGEVERITGLRVLATLGDLDKMSTAQQEKWAFRAWTIIAGQLTISANHGMVCGVISSREGEGRSTWIRLLGQAASQRGLRVLTVATKPSGQEEPSTEAENHAKEHTFSEAVDKAMAETQTATQAAGEPPPTTLSPSVLAFPAEVAQRFKRGDLPAAHIPLPGWVWNLDRRRQWQMALAHWRSVDNLVLLVELPPASVPESVLLAENLPQLLWLVDSGKPHIRETKEQLEMLHHGKCRIVGAVLNHEPEPLIKL